MEPSTPIPVANPGVPAPGGAPRARKRPKTVSPTTRTMHRARELGFTAEKVEQRVPVKGSAFGFTRDFINIIDIIAFMPGIGIVGIQATSDSNHAARMDKAKAEPMLRTWLKSGGRFEVWSWGLRGARGDRKLWTLRREELLADGRVVPSKADDLAKAPPLFREKKPTHIGGYKLAEGA